MLISKLASAIYNDIVSGLSGMHINHNISIEQLEDEVIETRLAVIKEYQLKGILPTDDLMLAINCVNIDCKDLNKCSCKAKLSTTAMAHFEIPQILLTYGIDPIDYIGSTDRQIQFNYYTSLKQISYQKYRKRRFGSPYVYIDTSPNENKMYDCYLYDAPLLKQVSIVAIFKDPRQLQNYSCCPADSDENMSFLDTVIKERLIKSKIYYYRQLQGVNTPNDQAYKP